MEFIYSLTNTGFDEIGAETEKFNLGGTIGAGHDEFGDENYGWAGEDILNELIYIGLLDRE